jgi:hypothetical protein
MRLSRSRDAGETAPDLLPPSPDETRGVKQSVGVVEKLEARGNNQRAGEPQTDATLPPIDDQTIAEEAIAAVERLPPIEANDAALLTAAIGGSRVGPIIDHSAITT